MAGRSIGRPLKYDWLLRALEDEPLYRPASIVQFGEREGLLRSDPNDPTARNLEKRRVLNSLTRLSRAHGFPREGDDLERPKNRIRYASWWGWRWKTLVKNPIKKP